MRNLVALALLLMTACERERKFNERYDDTRKQLEGRSARIDRELHEAESDAARVHDIPADAAT